MTALPRRTALAFGLAAPLAAPFVRSARAAEPFRVGYSSVGLLYLPLFVADRLGLFKEQGLDVETILFSGGGGSSLAAILGGNIDAAVGASNEALVAVSKGAPARLVGAIMTEYASNIVISGEAARRAGLTPASTSAQRLAALKGLSLGGGGPGSGSDLVLRYLALRAGLSPEHDITIVNTAGSDRMLAAFKLKRIDGFSWSSPTADTAVHDMDGFMLFNLNEGQFEPLRGYLYISVNSAEPVLRAKAEPMAKFMRGIAQAQAAMHDGTDRARDAVQPIFKGFAPDLYRAAWASVLPAYPKTPAVTPEQTHRIAALMKEMGVVTQDIPLDRWVAPPLA